MYFINCETLELMVQTTWCGFEQLSAVFSCLCYHKLYLSACPPLLLSCTSKISNSVHSFCFTLLSLGWCGCFYSPLMWLIFKSRYCFCLSLAGHVPIIFFHPLTAISVLPDFSSTEQWLWGMEKVVFLLDLWRKERVNVLDPASLKKNNWIPLLNKGYVFIIQSNHVMRDTCKPEIWSWGNLLLPVSRLNVKYPMLYQWG